FPHGSLGLPRPSAEGRPDQVGAPAGPGARRRPAPRRFGETVYVRLPSTMIDSTLIARSTSTIVAASVGGTPYTMVSRLPTPASTIPRPPGVNGTAVRSEPASATKNEPLMPRWTP